MGVRKVVGDMIDFQNGEDPNYLAVPRGIPLGAGPASRSLSDCPSPISRDHVIAYGERLQRVLKTV